MGDFADGKAEVSSSAMYIVRSFGDLTRADSIINCAGARLPMPSNPDEPPHQLRRTPVAVRIGRMQELAEMGYAIICKSCSNSTLNLQFGRWKPDFPAFIVARKRHEGPSRIRTVSRGRPHPNHSRSRRMESLCWSSTPITTV